MGDGRGHLSIQPNHELKEDDSLKGIGDTIKIKPGRKGRLKSPLSKIIDVYVASIILIETDKTKPPEYRFLYMAELKNRYGLTWKKIKASLDKFHTLGLIKWIFYGKRPNPTIFLVTNKGIEMLPKFLAEYYSERVKMENQTLKKLCSLYDLHRLIQKELKAQNS